MKKWRQTTLNDQNECFSLTMTSFALTRTRFASLNWNKCDQMTNWDVELSFSELVHTIFLHILIVHLTTKTRQRSTFHRCAKNHKRKRMEWKWQRGTSLKFIDFINYAKYKMQAKKWWKKNEKKKDSKRPMPWSEHGEFEKSTKNGKNCDRKNPFIFICDRDESEDKSAQQKEKGKSVWISSGRKFLVLLLLDAHRRQCRACYVDDECVTEKEIDSLRPSKWRWQQRARNGEAAFFLLSRYFLFTVEVRLFFLRLSDMKMYLPQPQSQQIVFAAMAQNDAPS